MTRKIRMNKEMPLNIEWMPQNAYMHSSLDHLLPGDRNQGNYAILKQDPDFFEDAFNPQSVENVCSQVSPKEKDRENKLQFGCSNLLSVPPRADAVEESPEKLTEASDRLCSKGRIDVIEMSAEPTSDYKYFFTYEDQRSKFVVLRALRSDAAKEVATKLFDVLAILGAPLVLLSGNGRKFAKEIVHELRSLWNSFLILHGDASKHIEVSRRDFKSSLESWMRKNPTKSWREGLNFVQISHNTTYRCRNGKIPCDILFEREASENFENLKSIKRDTVEGMWAEEEWIEHLSNGKDEGATAATGVKVEDSSDSANLHFHEGNVRDAQSQNESRKRDDDARSGFDFVNVRNDIFANANGTDPTTHAIDTERNEPKDNEEDSESLKCTYCQKRYMKLGHLKNHMRTHRAPGERVLSCKLCGKTFSVPRLYEKHMKQSHGQDKLLPVREEEEEVCAVRRSTRSTATRNGGKQQEIVGGSREPPADDPAKNGERTRSDTASLGDGRGKTASKSSARQSPRGKSSAESRGVQPKTQCALQCTYCKQKFSFPSVLERHMRSHTNERPYACDVCNKSFKQLGHLSQHSLTHHDYRSSRCTVCGIKFDSLDSLKQHSRSHSHHGDAATALKVRDVYRLFECDCCKKVFTTKSVLERHIFTHTQERQFDCKVCGKRFKQAGHVKSHMLVHTGERRFQCTVCSKRFSLSNSLKKHMYVHNGEKPYQCDVCGARFLEKRNLNGHLLTHTNERPFCCKICGKRYTLADTLRRHISAAHEDGRTYQCEICAKMFKQLAHLSVHKKVHNDERPFQCHLCEKNFKHKNVLKSHLAIHANVRPFECDVCKATFVRKTNLQTHILSAHMNERPYTCTICGKRFKQISHLNGHVVVHSNLMPYKCDYCDRRCNRLDNLKKHMRLHTKNKE